MEILEYTGYSVKILAGDGQIVTARPYQLRKLFGNERKHRSIQARKPRQAKENSSERKTPVKKGETAIEKLSKLNSPNIQIETSIKCFVI